MRKFVPILILSIFLTHLCSGQSSLYFHSDFEEKIFQNPNKTAFELFMAADPAMTNDKYNSFASEYAQLVADIDHLKTKVKDDSRFLQKAFYKIHRKQLGWYENHVTLSETLDSKKYDCLTGTALFALILDDLGYAYQILEFDFHVFVIVQSDNGQVLLEATDPMDGFVTDAIEIQNRIDSNIQSVDLLNAEVQKTYIRNEISLTALAGLQYFNIAVNFYNNREYKKASDFIKKADLLYPSERIRSTMLLFASASL